MKPRLDRRSGNTMVVVGVATGAGDFDPGPSVDMLDGNGGSVFISRYDL